MPDAPDAPIAAALRVAAQVLTAEGMEALLPDTGLRELWLAKEPAPEGMRQTAAAIAAFLRALPRSLSGHAYLIEPDEYAAAVERAAAGREGET